MTSVGVHHSLKIALIRYSLMGGRSGLHCIDSSSHLCSCILNCTSIFNLFFFCADVLHQHMYRGYKCINQVEAEKAHCILVAAHSYIG